MDRPDAPKSLRIDARLPSPPRAAVFRTHVRIVLLAAAVGYVAVAVLVAVLSRHAGARLERLRDTGVAADAVVVKKWTSGGKSKTRHVGYTFDFAGSRRNDESSLSSSWYDEIILGQRIRITVDPADPSDTELGTVTQKTVDRHWTVVLATSGVVGAVLLVFVACLWLHHWRRRTLLIEGDVISAKIESVGRPSRKGKVCAVAFVVPDGAGGTVTRKVSVPRKLLEGIEAGATVPWLVLRHDSKRGAPLGLCLRSCRFE